MHGATLNTFNLTENLFTYLKKKKRNTVVQPFRCACSRSDEWEKNVRAKKKLYNYKIEFQKKDYLTLPSPSELPEQANKETHNFGVPNPSCAMLEAITTAQAGRPKQSKKLCSLSTFHLP